MKNYKIAVIPGDGTGPEVIREGLKVMEAASQKFNFKYELIHYDFGGERFFKKPAKRFLIRQSRNLRPCPQFIWAQSAIRMLNPESWKPAFF
jgi:Isocitrate/isopropylmalate dehydrogenase